MRSGQRFLVWAMRLLLVAFAAVAVFGLAALFSGRAWGQGVGQSPAPQPVNPQLMVSPNYGEGAAAVWWVRTTAPELVVLVAPVLNGSAGCYMALGGLVGEDGPGAIGPQVWVYNRVTGDWTGDGDICRAGVERVREEWGGGVMLRVEFTGAWLVGAGAGRQTVWVMERGGGVNPDQWRRVGVWVVGPDAGGVAWLEGGVIPYLAPPAYVPPPPPPPPAPPLPTVTVTEERVTLAPGTTIPSPGRGCWWTLNGVTQTVGVDYPGLVAVGDGEGLTRLCVVLGEGGRL